MDEQGAKSVDAQMSFAADKAAAQAEVKGDDGAITLSTGVTLKVKPLPPMLMMEALTNIPRPKPPVLYDKRLSREIENPDDPDYQEQLSRYNMDYAIGVINAMILFGTEIVSAPKGMPKVSDEEWVENLELAGLQTLPESKSWRKLAWIKSVAVGSAKDSNLIMEAVGGASGVRESDVSQAAQAFRSEEKSEQSS